MKIGWLDRRVMWLLLALSYVYVSLYRLSTAVLSEDLASDFAATATEMGSLHAVFFAVYAPLQFAAGVLADRYGPRRVVAAGALVMHAGALAFSGSNSLELALAGRFLMGAGASVIFISTLRFCANWYGPRE
ncbi:MAG: MFS transporter, partial [Halobacteriales archaeon]